MIEQTIMTIPHQILIHKTAHPRISGVTGEVPAIISAIRVIREVDTKGVYGTGRLFRKRGSETIKCPDVGRAVDSNEHFTKRLDGWNAMLKSPVKDSWYFINRFQKVDGVSS